MKINQIKVGAILSYAIIFLNILIGVTYLPFSVKILGQSEYGLYSLVSSLISYITLLDFGFGNAITIYTAKYIEKGDKEKENKLHGMFAIIYTIIGIIAGVIGIILTMNVSNFFKETMSIEELQKAKILMSILTLNLVITFPFSIFNSIIVAYEKFIFNKLLSIIRVIIMPCIMLPLLLNGYKSIALATCSTVINVICLAINTFYCFKYLNIKLQFKGIDFCVLKDITAYSFFIFLNTIVDKVNWSIDNFILGKVKGTTEVAIYAVAANFNAMYLNFSTAISGVLLPKIAKMEANNSSEEEFSNIFIKTGRIQYMILGLIITGFIIFGKSFIQIFFGIDYTSAYYIACILMIPVTLPLIQNVGINILQAKNKNKFRTVILFFIAIANIFISIPLAKKYGGIGTAIGTAISFCTGQIIIMNIYYYKKIKINVLKFFKEMLKMSIPVFITFLIGIYFYNNINNLKILELFVTIILYSIIYVLLMWNFGMNNYEKNLLLHKLRKRSESNYE